MLRHIQYWEKMAEFLVTGFNESELRNFCLFTPQFAEVGNWISKSNAIDYIVREIVKHAYRRQCSAIVLEWAKAKNPNRYKRYEKYFNSVKSLPTRRNTYNSHKYVISLEFSGAKIQIKGANLGEVEVVAKSLLQNLIAIKQLGKH